MTPDGMTAAIHLTITDDYPLAQAFVIIEALGLTQPGNSPESAVLIREMATSSMVARNDANR
jgi:hypothetical protein